MKLRDLRIVTRLWMGFITILLMLLVIGGVGIGCLQSVGNLNHYMVGTVLVKQRLIADWYQATNANGYRTLALLRSSDAQQVKDQEEKVNAISTTITDIQNHLNLLLTSIEEKKILEEM